VRVLLRSDVQVEPTLSLVHFELLDRYELPFLLLMKYFIFFGIVNAILFQFRCTAKQCHGNELLYPSPLEWIYGILTYLSLWIVLREM
jgi:hypothetical protein